MRPDFFPHACAVLFASAQKPTDLLRDVASAVMATVLHDPKGDGADVLIVFHAVMIGRWLQLARQDGTRSPFTVTAARPLAHDEYASSGGIC